MHLITSVLHHQLHVKIYAVYELLNLRQANLYISGEGNIYKTQFV